MSPRRWPPGRRISSIGLRRAIVQSFLAIAASLSNRNHKLIETTTAPLRRRFLRCRRCRLFATFRLIFAATANHSMTGRVRSNSYSSNALSAPQRSNALHTSAPTGFPSRKSATAARSSGSSLTQVEQRLADPMPTVVNLHADRPLRQPQANSTIATYFLAACAGVSHLARTSWRKATSLIGGPFARYIYIRLLFEAPPTGGRPGQLLSQRTRRACPANLRQTSSFPHPH
jgi:hypothetical protein